jgi:hypothetical protein
MEGVIEKVVRKLKLGDPAPEREDLEYWLSRPPEERVAQIERLRREWYGPLPRLQRVARVAQQSRR